MTSNYFLVDLLSPQALKVAGIFLVDLLEEINLYPGKFNNARVAYVALNWKKAPLPETVEDLEVKKEEQ